VWSADITRSWLRLHVPLHFRGAVASEVRAPEVALVLQCADRLQPVTATDPLVTPDVELEHVEGAGKVPFFGLVPVTTPAR